MASWDFSRRGLARVVLVTIVGTAGTMALAIASVSYTTQFMDRTARELTFVVAIILPLIMSAPIFYFFSSKLRELRLARDELAEIASTDSLTTCLNRGAFITLVDAYLSQVNAPRAVSGTLLVVDADDFKGINDRFGHDQGDQALRIIAAAIKRTLRPVDIVGRIGGEEFAVFLPEVTDVQAKTIAERIRHSVSVAPFEGTGEPVRLTVSIGGAPFERPVPYTDLFKAADRNLYSAKMQGRNRVEFSGALAA